MSLDLTSPDHQPDEQRPLTILLVEDDCDIRAVATMSLGLDPNIRVAAVDRGSAALVYLCNEPPPDLVLLDNTLPDIDGIKLLALIHNACWVMRGRVAFFTAAVRDHELARFKAAGAIGVVQKPFEPLALASTVRKCL